MFHIFPQNHFFTERSLGHLGGNCEETKMFCDVLHELWGRKTFLANMSYCAMGDLSAFSPTGQTSAVGDVGYYPRPQKCKK